MTDAMDLIYVGCYTDDDGDGEGITAVRRHQRTGELTRLGLAARAPSPSFLTRHPGRPVLYAVSERPEGEVRAWRVTGDAHLEPIGSASTGGAGPCHLAVHPGGGYVLVANYLSGSAAVHRLEDVVVPGELTHLVEHEGRGPHEGRQEAPHIHMISIDPDGYYVHAVDLGTDAIFHYRFDTNTGKLTPSGPTRTQPGTGPRHVAGHGTFRFVVGELDASLTCYGVNSLDRSWLMQSHLPICRDGEEGYPSEVAVASDGRFVYTATRGPDRVDVFAHHAGHLRWVTGVPSGGHWPRHFALVGEHMYVANERSHNLVTFRVDPHTGVPEPTGHALEIPSPTCVFSFFPTQLR